MSPTPGIAERVNEIRELVAQNIASWNRLAQWLRGVSALAGTNRYPNGSRQTGPLEVD
jgi:hypothetical protein